MWLSLPAALSLTVLQRVLEHVVRHAAGPHGHVGHHVEGVVARRLQVVNYVARRVVSDDRLVFLVVQACKNGRKKKIYFPLLHQNQEIQDLLCLYKNGKRS